ncbi:autotransporter outer membrane beta-barrel domain-containing protein [Sphingomonas crocodyli]|uniref:Autotransporter domain-containing protein n=1 Tax=Sphingomonas crocodyli TaxID=1979270 RepID=A0A437M641_9SPHN|nr:autotransporter outer membrane beta-barrel domain-containing protein [Sphingomonas crocodyli]RVT93190.1 autotransporter domain-containing protein [Sphingomonas crocodyli]
MRKLLTSTCLVSIAAMMPMVGRAETLVDAKRTDPVRTSTIKAGAADDVRVTSAGNLNPTAGTALLIDSANKATNEGTIQITNADGSVGIGAAAGAAGTITNSTTGKIIIDETYAPTDADNDGDIDGPFAAGSGRAGIRTAGAFTGDVINNGAITVEGNDSQGIDLRGALSGKLTTDGTIAVTGDRTVGVRTGAISGPVRIAGTITAQGQGARAVSIEGDLAGALVVQGALTSTGYRTTTVPADTSKLDADDLLQGGPALAIQGDVLGGVILAVPPKDNSTTDNDEDKDGIEDSKEGTAAVTSYGAAPAVQIGAANRAVTIGPVAGTGSGHGLVIDGAVLGAGLYAGVNGTGVQIGGLGGAVTIAGGMTVNGKVDATSNGATATGIRIGTGATVAQVRVAGAVSAAGLNATAIQLEAGSATFNIANSGSIKATATSAGTAYAIRDLSGELDLIDNSGAISASGGTTNVAIDLSANTTGARIGQTVVATGVAAPSITGDILFGSGSDVLDIADGSVKGTTRFGAGANQLTMSGDATYDGAVSFGGGNDIVSMSGTTAFNGSIDFGGGSDTLVLNGTARYTGGLTNASGLAVTINGGRLDAGKSTASIASLSVGAAGTLGVTIDTASRTSTLYQVAGNASFAQGAKVAVRIDGIANAEGRYTFLRAGSVTGAAALATSDTVLPFMFKSSIVTTTPNELAVDIARKSTTELGLNRSQASAYNAIYTALGKDAKVAGVFLDTTDGTRFRKQLRQMLPDHAGGSFETVTMGSRATAGFLQDPNSPFKDEGNWGWFIQQVGWGTSKSLDDTAAYDITGWGLIAGGEIKTGTVGNFGLSLAYLYGQNADGGTDNKVDAGQYEVAGYWRGTFGPITGWARGSWGHVDFKGKRRFDGLIGNEAVARRARGDWSGQLVSASGGVNTTFQMGSFSLRPVAAVDYYRLKEKGYAERNGGDAFNLIVAGRTSDELAVTGTVAAGFDFGGWDRDSGWFRFEVEGGRRELVGGSLGKTTASFAGGQSFTLTPEERTSGWVGKVRAIGGNGDFRIGSEAGAEQQQGRVALSLRASLVVGF